MAQRDQTFLSDPFFPPYKQNLTSQKITNRLLLPPIGGGDLSERQRNFHILPLVFGLGLGGVPLPFPEGRSGEGVVRGFPVFLPVTDWSRTFRSEVKRSRRFLPTIVMQCFVIVFAMYRVVCWYGVVVVTYSWYGHVCVDQDARDILTGTRCNCALGDLCARESRCLLSFFYLKTRSEWHR